MKRHLASIDGTELHWAEMAPAAPSAPPVVLLHGINDSHRTWHRVAPELARDRRVLMPDLPGHGLSDRPDAPYDLFWYARVLGAWLEHLDLRDVDLVGHSYGGGVAQCMLLEHRDRIRRLALVSSGGLGREVGLPVRLMAMPLVVEKLGQPLFGTATRLYLTAIDSAFTEEEIAWLSWVNARQGTARAASRTVRDVVHPRRGQVRGFFDHAHRVDLPPVHLYWGDRDRIVPLSHGLEMQSKVDGVQLTTFMGAGHFPHQEKPEHFARALGEFLDAPRARSARLREAPTKARAPSFARRSVARLTSLTSAIRALRERLRVPRLGLFPRVARVTA